MKKSILIIPCLFSFCMRAQLFTGLGGSIRKDGLETHIGLPVTGLNPALLDSSFGLKRVCVSFSHPAVEELVIYLQSPEGELVELSDGNSGTGLNFTNTCYESNNKSLFVKNGVPDTGIYKATGYLGQFNNGQAGNGKWQLIVKDELADLDTGSVVGWNILFGHSPPSPVKFTSSNLPVICINSNRKALNSSEVLINVGIIDNKGIGQRNFIKDPWMNYTSKALFHIRVNPRFHFEKKSFILQTFDRTGQSNPYSFFGMPGDNDWSLLAGYQDKSLIRTPLGFDLFRAMGHYAPRFRDVELMLNNEYKGVYAFMEKPAQGPEKISVSKLTKADIIGPSLTGGYVLRIDRPGTNGWYSAFAGNISTDKHFFYKYDYPMDSVITPSQMVYIKSFLDSFELVMNSSSYNDPITGYCRYIDEGSFIDYMIIAELSKNPNAYSMNIYLSKDKDIDGGKLRIGPMGDFDLAWNNSNYERSSDPRSWQFQRPDSIYPSPNWWNRFYEDSNFVNKLYCRWHLLRENILSIGYLNNYIDSSANELRDAGKRNFIQWPVLGTTYQNEVDNLKSWLADRIDWMDGALAGRCPPLGILANRLENKMEVYPNPFVESMTAIFEIKQTSKVRLSLLNSEGVEVLVIFEDVSQPGVFQDEIETRYLTAGNYNLELNVNDHLSYKKLIKVNE